MSARARSPHPPESDLGIVVSQRGTTTIVELDGECDLAGLADFRDAIGRALACDPRCVVLDLSRLSFIDAGGIHVVLELAHRSRAQQAHLVICPGPWAVQHVFEVCQLTEILPFVITPLQLEEPRDLVLATNGDAGSGGAPSARPLAPVAHPYPATGAVPARSVRL